MKALVLLQRKDEAIEHLQGQLAESTRVLTNLRQQREAGPSTSRSIDVDKMGSFLVERVSQLELSLKDSIAKCKQADDDHEACRVRLEKALEEAEVARELRRQEDRNSRVEQSDQQLHELRGLRERTMDQAEQIDVLVTEIAKLRSESQSSGSLVLAQEEISRLQSEMRHLQSRIDSLKQENSSLHQTVERLNASLASAIANAAAAPTNEEVEIDVRNAFFSPNRSNKIGHVSWGGAGAGLDAHTENMTGQPVSTQFNAKSMDDMSHALQERTAQVHLYQERAEGVESENDDLRARLTEAREVEHDLRQKLKEKEISVAERETEIKILVERTDRFRSEKEAIELKLEDREVQLRSALGSSAVKDAKNRETNAHVWWSYVWHELKRQNSEYNVTKDSFMCPDETHHIAGDDSAVKIATLRASLSAQAVELASIRQELLGRKLSSKTEIASLKEQIDQLQRENVRLNAQIRTHRGDKEMRLAEMAVTIRALSARSDIHVQLASARQELETEKIVVHHLRADVDSYRSMLESEQSKIVYLRKEASLFQGMLDASAVMKTVTDVPGVDPAVLIEMMSGKIGQLQAEVAKGKNTVVQAQTHINNLQRSLASEKKRQPSPAIVLEIAPGKHKPSTANPVFSRNTASEELKETDAATLDEPSLLDESSIVPSVGTFSIAVDGECTPQKVLDSLDAAALAHHVHMQEAHIADLKAEVARLMVEAVRGESARLEDRDHYEDSYRIDAESSSQKQELMQISIDEAKIEISNLRQQNMVLEKTICDLQVDSILGVATPNNTGNNVYPTESDLNLNESLGDTTFIDAGEVREELEKSKLLLRERTTQLKILMQTLDALHAAGVKEKENVENMFSDNLMDGLAMVANSPLPNVEGSWGIQALVKRVVELTTELTSQCAVAAMEERRANQMEDENKRNSRELNKLRSMLRSGEESNSKLQTHVAILCERTKECEKLRVEQASTHRREFDDLLSALRDAETKVSAAQVTINEMKQRASLVEKDGFQEWIEHIITEGFTPPAHLEEISKPEDESAVKSMVASLLKEWREHVGAHPHRSPKSGGTLSKSEQRFLQRVTDLVMESNRVCKNAVFAMRQAEMKAENAESSSQITIEKLKVALLHLHRYRKRSHALEKIVKNDSRFEITQGEKVNSLLRRSLLDERRKNTENFSCLVIERRDNKLNELKKVFDTKKMLFLQHRVAELEARGNAALRGREEASLALESRVKASEESMHRWFKAELPRLISGLPLTEDTMGLSYTLSTANGDIDFVPGLGFNKDAQQSAAALGLDRTFALAQALCCSKASATVQDIKLIGAMEKNSILKSRVIELEGVLERWKNDIDAVEARAAFIDTAELATTGAMQQENALYSSSDTQAGLMDRIQQLTARLLEVEEENIVVSGRLEHSSERNEEMKGLVDLIMKEEEILKHKVTKQIEKIRSDLEFQHAAELRNIREVYEYEKKELTEELEKVLGAIDFARATVDSSPLSVPMQTSTGKGMTARASSVPQDASKQQGKTLPEETFDDSSSESVEDGRSRVPVMEELKTDQSSVMMTVVDATEEVGSRIRTLLSQLTAGSQSQRITASLQQLHRAASIENQGFADRQENAQLQQEIESLQNALETERIRSREARAEAFEFEQLLNAQRAAFSDRVSGVIENAPAQGRPHHSSQYSASNSISSPPVEHFSHRHHSDTASTHGTLDEDASLWPSLGSLLDELNSCLQHLPARYKSLSNDSFMRTALAMVARLKRALAHGAEGLNLATPVTDIEIAHSDTESPQSFRTGDEEPTLRSLLNQVQMVETKFVSEKLPERSIMLLRDLRLRVAEIEQSISTNFEQQKESWENERSSLMQSLHESAALVESLRLSQEEASTGTRKRYEDALIQSQEALEQQTAAATEQLTRMDELLRGSQTQNEHQRQQLLVNSQVEFQLQEKVSALQTEIEALQHSIKMAEGAPVFSSPPLAAPAPAVLPSVSSATSAQLANSSLEELLKLQRLLERATDDLDTSNRKNRALEEKRLKDAGIIRDLNLKLKKLTEARAKTVSSSKANSAEYAQLLTKGRSPDADEHTQELEEHLRKIEYRYRSKSAELDAIVKSISKAGNVSMTDGSIIYGSGDSVDDSLVSNTDMSILPMGVRNQIVEARLHAAEVEVESLQNILSKERKEVLHQARLQKLAASNIAAGKEKLKEKEREKTAQTPPRSRTPSRLKEQQSHKPKSPVSSPARKREEYVHISVVAEKERMLNDEIKSLRLQVTDARTQMQTLRDDVIRKSRLVTSLKAARQAEGSAADHWRLESQSNEESKKRMHRAIASKDAIIKDLRAKLEAHVEETERDSSGQPHYSAVDASSAPTDLKTKLKAAEVEQSRARARLSVMRDRLTEAESEIRDLKEENGKLLKSSEKCEAHRVAAARKESQIRVLKAQLENLQAECRDAALESDRQVRYVSSRNTRFNFVS